MKRLFLLFLCLSLGATIAIASPPTIDLGTAKLILNPNSHFSLTFKGPKPAKSDTLGDPQVHYRGRYFYWPTKTVVYVIGSTRIIGHADSPSGYTTKLEILRPGKPTKVVNFPDGKRTIISSPTDYLPGSRGLISANALRLAHVRNAPRIIWVGGKQGWVVRWKSKRIAVAWHAAIQQEQPNMNPVEIQQPR